MSCPSVRNDNAFDICDLTASSLSEVQVFQVRLKYILGTSPGLFEVFSMAFSGFHRSMSCLFKYDARSNERSIVVAEAFFFISH